MPYLEQVIENLSYRVFPEDVQEEELIWHQDAEDRIVEALHDTDWMFQFDNDLPISFRHPIYISKGVIHRVIKGTTDLVLRVRKMYDDYDGFEWYPE